MVKKIGVPTAVYIDKNDILELAVYNSLANLNLLLKAKILTKQGIKEHYYNHNSVASDRSIAAANVGVPMGYLLSASVIVNSAVQPKRGQTYVLLRQGTRNPVTGGILTIRTLIGNYIQRYHHLTWPGSRVLDSIEGPGYNYSVTGTDPAAGAEISEAVPTNARWKLRSIRFRLVTDATVADRSVILRITDATNVKWQCRLHDVQQASETRDYNFALDGPAFHATEDGGAQLHQRLPDLGQLPQAWEIDTSTTNLQAGDNYGAPQLTIEEWIEE